MFVAPPGSENVNAKVWAEPLPEFGDTETTEGDGPPNDADSVMGPFMVTDVLFAEPVKEPVPVPVQPENVEPLGGVAEIATVCPALNHPLGGLTVPAAPAFMVRKY